MHRLFTDIAGDIQHQPLNFPSQDGHIILYDGPDDVFIYAERFMNHSMSHSSDPKPFDTGMKFTEDFWSIVRSLADDLRVSDYRVNCLAIQLNALDVMPSV